MTDVLTARGLRGGAPDPLPELADEQAELLAFWLQERGYRMVADGEPMAPVPGLDDHPVRLRALEFACSTVNAEHFTDQDVVDRAEMFWKFLMGEGDDADVR